MIGFTSIFDLTGPIDQRQFNQAAELFRAAFPSEPEAIDRIEWMIRNRSTLDFEPALLIATDGRRRPTGLCFTFYFPELRYGYLQYIASDLKRSSRGIGGALYEALRELLVAKGARGLFLDVNPWEASLAGGDARDALARNRRRVQFYRRYGVLRVADTEWEHVSNPRNDYHATVLLFDPLGRSARLARADARKTVRSILVNQYDFPSGDPYVERIVRSVKADPVALADLPGGGSTPEPQPPAGHLRPIKTVWSEGHSIHHLKEKGYVERPVRVRAILRGLEQVPCERIRARHFAERHLTAVHDARLVTYLKTVCGRLSDKAVVYPTVFPVRRPERAPAALEDRAGYFCADTFTPLTRNAWPAAKAAADCALTGANLLVEGEHSVYAICRPPGHHAERRIYGGFCFLNNSAIAANFLTREGRVALLDIDYHHGNGAQDIFYGRKDVCTISIHGHPRHAYPNFSGYADERGEGEGRGYNFNFPLEPPVDDERYLSVLDEALKRVRAFDPRFLVLSLGFDIMGGDPTGSFVVSVTGIRKIAQRIGALRMPLLVVQEGGYSARNLRRGARAFFSELARSWYRG